MAVKSNKYHCILINSEVHLCIYSLLRSPMLVGENRMEDANAGGGGGGG